MALSKQQAPKKNLLAFLAHAASLGFHVGEHPAYGGVTDNVHRAGSWHPDGLAADINWRGSGSERAKILQLIPAAERYGLGITFARDGIAGSAVNHQNHLHVDCGSWSNYGKGAVRAKRATITVNGNVLQRGSTGARVGKLQAGLNSVFPAYSDLVRDNVYGAQTEAVVTEFQKRVGIMPDGVVGPVTRAALRQFGIRV